MRSDFGTKRVGEIYNSMNIVIIELIETMIEWIEGVEVQGNKGEVIHTHMSFLQIKSVVMVMVIASVCRR